MSDDAEDLVVVYVSQGPLGAEVAKSKLEAQGIPVMLRYEAIGRIMGITVDGLGRVEVLVPLACEENARVMLQEIEDRDDDESPDLSVNAS